MREAGLGKVQWHLYYLYNYDIKFQFIYNPLPKIKKKISCRLFLKMNQIASGEVPLEVFNKSSISHEQ